MWRLAAVQLLPPLPREQAWQTSASKTNMETWCALSLPSGALLYLPGTSVGMVLLLAGAPSEMMACLDDQRLPVYQLQAVTRTSPKQHAAHSSVNAGFQRPPRSQGVSQPYFVAACHWVELSLLAQIGERLHHY